MLTKTLVIQIKGEPLLQKRGVHLEGVTKGQTLSISTDQDQRTTTDYRVVAVSHYIDDFRSLAFQTIEVRKMKPRAR